MKKVIQLLKELEGFSLKPYKDPIGLLTIGVGHLITKPDNRLRVISGSDLPHSLTEKQVEQLLEGDLKSYDGYVRKMVMGLSQHQQDALTSFTFNVGKGAFKKSTLLRKLKKGRPDIEVANEFLRWNKAGGKVLTGLIIRRWVEAYLFLKDKDKDKLQPPLTKYKKQIDNIIKVYQNVRH